MERGDGIGDRMKVRMATRWAAERLAASTQMETAARDAAFLLRHALGVSQAAFLAHPERLLQPEEEAVFAGLVERRLQAEPMQYITGVQEFYGLPFRVTPAVLIPRPETELLVEAAVALAQGMQGMLRILDVGTGSGAIAVALAHLLPEAEMVATDLSAAALEVARSNAAELGVGARVRFVEGDLIPEGLGRFEMICSNPPYVPSGERLERQVAAYEPHTALFAGEDGLAVYRRLVSLAAQVLAGGGWLLLEIGHGQQPAVEGLLREAGLVVVECRADLQGIPRVVVSRKDGEGPCQ